MIYLATKAGSDSDFTKVVFLTGISNNKHIQLLVKTMGREIGMQRQKISAPGMKKSPRN